ncbi:MAG: SH3 domain-containing protein [Syntrophaceae bacterium]|nr:SH3 domain-containing protein [Syntrophaceae bacterium]
MKKKWVWWFFGVLWLVLLGSSDGGAVIDDLTKLSQDPLAYCDPVTADWPLLPADTQQRFNAEYDQLYFAPWHRDAPLHTLDHVSWGFRKYGADPGYDRTGKRRPANWIRALLANAQLENYPQDGFPAILVKRADFRAFPTRDVHSSQPRPADGYAFDNLQISSEQEGTPILVTLVSRDGKWLLAETSAVLGWIPAESAARVDLEFIQQWESDKTVVFIIDDVPVRDEKGKFCFEAPLGAIFPKIDEEEDRVWIHIAVRDGQGKAIIRKAWVEKKTVEEKPILFTARQTARVAAALVGEPYRWGGIDGRRDCSSLIQDIFAPFGIWLPRNSREQAEDGGRFIDFKGLNPAEKEARVLREGIPWRTLLWMPGHIMLYIGALQGRPLIFHNFWSVKTRDAAGNPGQIIVGQASITTLRPGRERADLDLPRADYLHSLGGMTLLGELPFPTPDAGLLEALP